jgi:hypothetical protein
MNGSTENTAHGAPEKPGRGEVLLKLATARKMLPLVERIVGDLLHNSRTLALLLPEQERLDQYRRDLIWPDRARRYQLQSEIAGIQRNLDEARGELDGLGVAVMDVARGEVGFPTLVDGRRAYFSWRAGEADIRFWHFAEESERRPIPAGWMPSAGTLIHSKG